MAGWQEFTGLNRGYVLELYEKYRQDPARGRRRDAGAVRALDAAVRARRRFRTGVPLQKIVGAVSLAQSIRMYGHLAARLDPLGDAGRQRRSVAAAGNPRRHRRGSPQPAGQR